jgi:transcriptional regulator with XRE-family HTH domain
MQPNRQRGIRHRKKALRHDNAFEETPKIGLKLRQARTLHGYRLRELAAKVGCSESFLSKIENNKVRPSLRTLHRIASELDTSIGLLFTERDTRVILRKGTRQIINTSGSNGPRKNVGVKLEWLIPYPLSVLLSGSIHIVEPGGSSEGLIAHTGEEVGYVLEGQFELTVGDETFLLEAGDSFFFPSTVPHGYRNPGNVTTRVIWVNTPPTF